MQRQLHLLTPEVAGRGARVARPNRHHQIDAKTRAVGRRGLAQARAALHAAQSVDPTPTHPTPSRPSFASSSNVRRSAA
ncbi:MAG TPA: hypothetical protein VGJ86_10810 [Acidimicrobiales bacterium]